MVEKIKSDADRPHLVLIIKKISIDFAKIELFSFPKPKVVYLRPFLSTLIFF